ncbi:MAG TPA: hypothetical protein VGJ15_04635 [Pirellulales bacterium]
MPSVQTWPRHEVLENVTVEPNNHCKATDSAAAARRIAAEAPGANRPREFGLASTGQHARLIGANQSSIELLELLDDVVYDFVYGRTSSGEKVTQLWQQICRSLPPQVLAATREQYLRYTLTLWDSCLTSDRHDPERAICALDVLTVLFEAAAI